MGPAGRRLALGGWLAIGLAACDLATAVTSPPATPLERMPGPASIWLTSAPMVPTEPVAVVMTSPDEPSIRFAHTFVAGSPLRGTFATSEGHYLLAALDGACRLPVVLGANEAIDIVLRLEAGPGCSFAIERRGRLDDPAMAHPEEAVLITNRDAGAATPAIEPVTSNRP